MNDENKEVFWGLLIVALPVLLALGSGYAIFVKFGIQILLCVIVGYLILGLISLGVLSRWGFPKAQGMALPEILNKDNQDNWVLRKKIAERYKKSLPSCREHSKKFAKENPGVFAATWLFMYAFWAINAVCLFFLLAFTFSKQGFRLEK